jgi:glycosyltransferase involved in cell wall biosynthesis
VIPAFNEEAGILEVIEGVRGVVSDAEVIVVDDASTDRTGEIAESSGAKVVRHPYRKGNGAAVKSGIRNASGEILVMLDGDGQHPPDHIPALLEPMDMYDMVVGARQNNPEISRLRSIGNAFYNRFASYVTNMKIGDLTSGFRAIRSDMARRYLYLLPNGYSYPTTITLAMIKAGYSVTFAPFMCRVRKGRSKLNPFKDGLRFLVIMLKIATLFSPMRIFAPLSAFFIGLGIGWYIYIYIVATRLPKMSLLLILVGVMVFLMGLVAEQISMLRMDTRE